MRRLGTGGGLTPVVQTQTIQPDFTGFYSKPEGTVSWQVTAIPTFGGTGWPKVGQDDFVVTIIENAVGRVGIADNSNDTQEVEVTFYTQ